MVGAAARAGWTGVVALAATSCLVSVPDVIPVQCTDDADCAAPTPFCETVTGTCIECRDSSVCPVEEPACSPAGACTQCTGDAHCPGTPCLPDGTCSDPARLLYASASGTGTECTLAAPCTLETAFAQVTESRDVIVAAPGVYPVQNGITAIATVFATGVEIVGDAKTYSMSFNVGADVTMVGGLVRDGYSGVWCESGARVRLDGVTVSGNTIGVDAGGDVTITRSTIDGNRLTGVYVSAGTTTISNTYVTDNGTDGGGFMNYGGVAFADGATGRIELTTIAGNTSYLGAGGITCEGTHVGLVITSSIIHTNITLMLPAVSDICPLDYSVVEAFAGSGTGNQVGTDPQFVDPAAGDYHVRSTSPARAAADPALAATIDHDGDPRPRPAGTAADAGADEIAD